VRARFSFDRYADRAAHQDTQAMTDADLLNVFTANINHPWRPPGGGVAGALSHDVIHGLDITEPLGLPAPPPDRVALVLGNAAARNLEYFGVNLGGTRLVASDADVAIGEGREVKLPAKDLVLIITGRKPLPA
ncbi:hypothetical protein, partial [Nocardia sp. NPDC046763]|uniref:hypothetical protein n=1 Tax=Nocardia sp. NPDC046763 TaxID=3155256 RepID=UPI0033CAEA64